MNQKRTYSKFKKPQWRKEDSDPEDVSDDFEEEEGDYDLKDFANSLKELLEACRKLSGQLSQIQSQPLIQPTAPHNQ